MKPIHLNILLLAAIVACSISCIGRGQPQQAQQEDWQQGDWQQEETEQKQDKKRRTVFAEQPKTVHAYAPDMNNMEMLRMTQLPGWQLLAGTQWIGNAYCTTIKGVNDNLDAYFIYDGNRNYTQTSMAQSGTTDGRLIYLNVMSAADYLDYAFRRQFPNVQGARRTMLKTLDMYSEAERRQVEEYRVAMYNSSVQFNRQSAGGQYTHVRAQTADRATAEYKWVQNGDSIGHAMEVFINATYTDFRGPYGSSSTVSWSQGWMITATAPVKNKKKMMEDMEKMFSSLKWNEQYIATLNSIVMAGMQREDAEVRRIQAEMAQSAMRHQQRMAQIMQETQEYRANVSREVFANREASQARINQGWRDAIVGVDRFMGTDGKVVEVPVSMGSKVWQSADAGTIYTSDRYLFSPIDNLYDKNGNWQEFRQLQLMK